MRDRSQPLRAALQGTRLRAYLTNHETFPQRLTNDEIFPQNQRGKSARRKRSDFRPRYPPALRGQLMRIPAL